MFLWLSWSLGDLRTIKYAQIAPPIRVVAKPMITKNRPDKFADTELSSIGQKSASSIGYIIALRKAEEISNRNVKKYILFK